MVHSQARMGGTSIQLPTLFFLSLLSMFSYLEASESSIKTGCIKKEREALIQFKQALEDPSNKLSSWTGEDCCKWFGVSCSNQTGHVVKLDLSNTDCYIEVEDASSIQNSSCLGGMVSPSLLDLKNLNFLDLSMNNFQSIPIPEFFGSLEKLNYLDLSYSQFSGLVPPHLGNLSDLHYLDLSSNFPNSTQPDIWVSDLHWLSHLSSLEYLNLGFVNLSLASNHWLQALNNLPSLSKLYLQFCELDNIPGFLPNVNFTPLTVIDLSNNNFQPSTPEWLFNLSSLAMLDLSYNQINGDIGTIIDGFCRCCTNSLQELYLVSDQLSGQLPETLGFFKKLRFLYLLDNLISGPIPTSVGSLLNLEGLDLSYNKMTGPIPQIIGKLTKLVALYLFQNSWEGVVSENHFNGLRNLEYLDLSSSNPSMVLNMSDDWVPPFSLRFIRISSCKLGPRFPPWFRTQKQLSRMHLTNVGISDSIPDWLWESSSQIDWLDFSNNELKGVLPSSLEFPLDALVDLSFNRLEGPIPSWRNVPYLNLAKNLLSGSIPSTIGQEMPLMKFLNLSENSLNGTFPPSIGEMRNLQRLDLSNNRLSGKIHDIWGHSRELLVLDLSMNNLSGIIPSSIFSLPKLQWLKLNGNKLSGELSFPMINCPSLTLLDLGGNELSGEIPKWLGESLVSVSKVKLRSNMLTNNIPENLCNLSNLHILDLADNNLSGPIPSCLGNLTSFRIVSSYEPNSTYHLYPFIPQMELVVKGREFTFSNILKLVNSIDLSSNNLVGEIPEEITNLLILGTLNLSHNQLSGKIPERIGNLRKLETLDLSSNQLTGPIPTSMSSMTLINHLNISHNKLSGPIPSTNQFQTFNDPSIYEGNTLCGDPLPKKCQSLTADSSKNKGQAGNNDESEEEEKFWFSLSIGMGFVFGNLGVVGSFVMKKSWRYAYFKYLDYLKDWLIVEASTSMKYNKGAMGRD